MGNTCSSSGGNGRRHHRRNRPSPPPPKPDIANPNPPPYYEMGPNWVPAMPPPLAGGRYPCGPVIPPHAPYIELQKAVTIKVGIGLKKGSLKIEADEEYPGKILVSFTVDALVAGSITIFFFAKEGDDCNLTPTEKSSLLPLTTVYFEEGMGQKFIQPSGTGIDLSTFEEAEILKVGDMEVYPLSVKIESPPRESYEGIFSTGFSMIYHAVFEKDKGEYKVREVKEILWISRMRYEVREIYGIGNSVDGDFDANDDKGKECVMCLSEPRDTNVLPCRHMCMCNGCARVMRFQTNRPRCPICKQPVERLLQMEIRN